jgi:hypothetical protein
MVRACMLQRTRLLDSAFKREKREMVSAIVRPASSNVANTMRFQNDDEKRRDSYRDVRNGTSANLR